MKTKEFNLSDKIVDLTGGIEFLENADFALDVEDVKEFIRLLKEKCGCDSERELTIFNGDELT